MQIAAERLLGLVQGHVSGAQLVAGGGGEVALRLPKEQSRAFPEVRHMKGGGGSRSELGFSTTLVAGNVCAAFSFICCARYMLLRFAKSPFERSCILEEFAKLSQAGLKGVFKGVQKRQRVFEAGNISFNVGTNRPWGLLKFLEVCSDGSSDSFLSKHFLPLRKLLRTITRV
jgi:hypothetical protein